MKKGLICLLLLLIAVVVYAADSTINGLTGGTAATNSVIPIWENGASSTTKATLADVIALGGGAGTATWESILKMTGSADHTASGIEVGVTCGATLAIGDAVYMGSGGKVLAAKADSATTMPAIGLMATTCNDTDTNKKMLINGVMRHDAWDWTAPGNPIYVSAVTAGQMTTVAPTTAGYQIQRVGIAIDADNLLWMPSLDVGEAK